MAITARDELILKFINIFGKSYPDVLGQTFFNGLQQARNRIVALKRMDLIDYHTTGLVNPRNALVLTSLGKRFLSDRGIDIKKSVKIHVSTIEHNIIEQVCYFWLNKLGDVTRTTVYHHAATLNHVPDLIYKDDKGRKFYIEVELNQKSMNNYNSILNNTMKDNPHGVIYVTQTEQRALSLAKNMPTWNKLFYIDSSSFVKNIQKEERISPATQESLAVRLF
jgi:glycerol-3-phosphate responsive antiterminator